MPTLFAFRLPRFAETKVDGILPLKSTLLENCTILNSRIIRRLFSIHASESIT
jgi:glycerol-3-phosphate responsive antiterminator